jgi:hypothetical protein
MSSQPITLTNTIHLRDFVNEVVDDPTSSYIEIHTDLNIFEEDQFQCSALTMDLIPTRIRAYVSQAERGLYAPEAFIYADGRFSAVVTSGNVLEIRVHALSLMRCAILNLTL